MVDVDVLAFWALLLMILLSVFWKFDILVCLSASASSASSSWKSKNSCRLDDLARIFPQVDWLTSSFFFCFSNSFNFLLFSFFFVMMYCRIASLSKRKPSVLKWDGLIEQKVEAVCTNVDIKLFLLLTWLQDWHMAAKSGSNSRNPWRSLCRYGDFPFHNPKLRRLFSFRGTCTLHPLYSFSHAWSWSAVK